MLWLLFIGRWSVSHCDNLAKVALHWTQVYKVAVAYGWSPNEQQSQRQTLLSSFGDLDVSYGFQWPDTKMAPSQLFEKGGRRLTNTFFTGKKLIKFFQEHFLQISSSSFFAKTVKVTVFQEEEKESFFFPFSLKENFWRQIIDSTCHFFLSQSFFSPFLSRSGGSSTLVNVGTIFWLQRWPQILVFWKLRILMIEEKASKERQCASTVWFKSFF